MLLYDCAKHHVQQLMASTSVNDYQNIIIQQPSRQFMKRLRVVLAIMLLLIAGIPAAFAQKRTVSGKITDKSGKPVPFVNVTVKGTTVGTTSNSDGVYSIALPEKSNTLVFTFVGYR